MARASTNNNAINGGLGPANLVHCPANLYTLWNEYKVGVGDNKAAKEFTPKEHKVRVTSKYCRRKKCWVAMERLLAAGADSNTAIHKIYEVYNTNSKVSHVLKRNDCTQIKW